MAKSTSTVTLLLVFMAALALAGKKGGAAGTEPKRGSGATGTW